MRIPKVISPILSTYLMNYKTVYTRLYRKLSTILKINITKEISLLMFFIFN